MMISELFGSEDDPRVALLRQRLDAFYESTQTYDAFSAPSFDPEFWSHVRAQIDATLRRQESCRVLEFGAGCTGFRSYLGDRVSRVSFEVQDITGRHAKYLAANADVVHIDDLLKLSGEYDVIFSTFVWEHITTPRQVLAHLLALLGPGGRLLIASPRYDFPLYLSPSAGHYGRLRKLRIAMWLLQRRLRVLFGGQADFLIHLDPAVLNRPWYRDSDAIHWVSMFDLSRQLPKGYQLKRLRIPARGWRWRISEKYLQLFVHITRTAGR